MFNLDHNNLRQIYGYNLKFYDYFIGPKYEKMEHKLKQKEHDDHRLNFKCNIMITNFECIILFES